MSTIITMLVMNFITNIVIELQDKEVLKVTLHINPCRISRQLLQKTTTDPLATNYVHQP